MPSHYPYQCSACGKIETRYRNARRSRCCHAEIVRLEDKPIDWEGHVANLQAEVDRLRAENERLQRQPDEDMAKMTTMHANFMQLRRLLRDVLPIVEFAVKEYHSGTHPLLEQIRAYLGA